MLVWSGIPALAAGPEIINQPQSQAVISGDIAVFTVLASSDDSLTYEWRKNGAPIDGATESGYVISSAQPADAGTYSVAVTAGGITEVSDGAALTVNSPAGGDVDFSFDPGSSMSANGGVRAMAMQSDGKVLIGGDFTSVNGASRARIARLNPDGSTDFTFGHGLTGANDGVQAVAVQSDGKVLIGGYFSIVNGVSRTRIARLNSDGSLDADFQNGLTGANNRVRAIAVQSDGKVLIGGDFTSVNGVARTRIARLNSDGSLDAGFQNGVTGANGSVLAIAVQSDGKVLIGGAFSSVNGSERYRIARLNSNGSLDPGFQNSLANSTVWAVDVQSDGRIFIGGDFTAVNGATRNRIARLHSDGSLDPSFQNGLAGANSAVYASALQSDGKVIIGGYFTSVNGVLRNRIARLNNDGSLDTEFQDGLAGANNTVVAFAVQSEAKVLVGGYFTSFNGLARNRLARLKGDGSLETDFQVGRTGANGTVLALAVQNDGKVLIGGDFTSINGVVRNRIARLNRDGSLDTSFQDGLTGANSHIRAVAVQSDGKVLIGGHFTTINGVVRNRIARLNSDGSLDTEFQDGMAGANSVIHAVAVQGDGKVLIGGYFTSVNGVARNRIARLNSDGSLDPEFQDGMAGANNWVWAVAVQSDGKALIGGYFTSVNGVTRNRIARLNSDGSLDTEFQAGLTGASSAIYSVALQGDGKVLIGGYLTSASSISHNGIARLNSDGSLDPDFQDGLAGADSTVLAVAVQSDGKVLVGGHFTSVNGVPRDRVARLHAESSALTVTVAGVTATDKVYDGGTTATVNFDNATLVGVVGGDDVTLVTAGGSGSFQNSAVGESKTVLIAGLTLSGADADRYSLTQPTATASITKPVAERIIVNQPQPAAVLVTHEAVFTVLATGEGTLTYQWSKDGTPIPGATAAALVISNAQLTNAGSYSVAVTDDTGTTVSEAAGLTVNDIHSGDLDLSFNVGSSMNGTVNSFAVQPDGKVVIAGTFTMIHGAMRGRIARLHPDGTTDHSFGHGLEGANSTVESVAVAPDGKILIGGDFTEVNGMPRNRIARLNSDGSLDPAFQNGMAGANGTVSALEVQNDGQIVIAGSFTAVNGVTRNKIARLNGDGSPDNFQNGMAGANSSVSAVKVQSDGKVLVGGYFTSINGVSRNRIARLHSDGSLDPAFQNSLTGADKSVWALAMQSDGRVLIAGDFTSVNDVTRNRIARLNSDGSLDLDFQSDMEGADNRVYAVAEQSDGKVLVGGNFTSVNGATRNRIARLNSDGSLDSSFLDDGTGANNFVRSVAVAPDGEILIAGAFSEVNGVRRDRIARLNDGGAMESSFLNGPAGASDFVASVVVATDGKVVIGGQFTQVNDVPRNRIARLNSDGSLDTDFQNGLAGANNSVSAVGVTGDGGILIAGRFTEVNGVTRNRIARLNSDGSLDANFQNGLAGANGTIRAMAMQSDGKVLVGGDFTSVNEVARNRIARLNSDGSLDTNFQDGLAGANDAIFAIAVQSDGKVLVGGDFTSVNEVTRNRIARLNSDGSLDTTFLDGLAGANSEVFSIATAADGKVLIGGRFTAVNGVARNRVARLNLDGSTILDGLAGANSTVRSIALDPNGKILLGGDFTRINGVERNRIARLNRAGSLETSFLDGLPGANASVSSIAVTADRIFIAGQFTEINGVPADRVAALFLEMEPPEPIALTVSGVTALDKVYDGDSTATVDFSSAILVGVIGDDDVTLVTAGGSGSFQNSEVGENKTVLIAGLTLSGADAGNYSLTPPTATASITELAADRVIVRQPQPTAVPVSHRAVFTVLATGEGTLRYQWFKNGTLIQGATQAGLVIASAQFSDSGVYSVAVTDDNGTTTSEGAGLAVNGLRPGDLELSFDVGSSINGTIRAIAVQADGKVIIGGAFTAIHNAMRGRVARLHPDGSTDHSFGHGLAGADADVWSVAVAPNGKVLIGGVFTEVNGEPRNRIARLNSDGSLDTTFLDGLEGANNTVRSVAVAEGGILIGGSFTEVNGASRNRIARLNGDGSVDASFLNGLAGANSTVESVTVAGDGKVVIGGGFSQVNGVARNRIARLNGDGTLDTSFLDGLSGAQNPWNASGDSVLSIALLSDGKVLIAGRFTEFNGEERPRIARLHSDGSLDTTFSSSVAHGEFASVESVAVAPDGKILIAGDLTDDSNPSGRMARLNSDGSRDTSFPMLFSGVSYSTSRIYSVAVVSEGKVLIGGQFQLNGGISNLARLNSDGSTDGAFLNGRSGMNGNVNSIAVAAEAKVLIGGGFTSVNGIARNRIARLNSDGSLDTSFLDGLAGADGLVRSVALAPDGKILICGDFFQINGVARYRIARLNSNGSLDTTFNSFVGISIVGAYSMAVTAEGKILLGGGFTSVSGMARNGIARLNSDGSLDTTFLDGLAGANNIVSAVAVAPDGKILIAGWFTEINGVARNRIARLNSDGSLDTTFLDDLAGANNTVRSIALADEKILIGGLFTSVNDVSRNRIARLNSDGSLDPTFLDNLAGANNSVDSVTVAADGRIFIGGAFTEVNGVPRNRIARLNSDGSLETSFLDGLPGANASVSSVVAAAGEIFIGGSFTEVNRVPVDRIAVLQAAVMVEPIYLTVSGVTASDKPYDGETSAVVDFSNATLLGVDNGDDVTLVTAEGFGSFASKAVGPDITVSVSGLALSGEDAGNYFLTPPTATASITARGLTVAGVTAADKAYDGGIAAMVDFSSATLAGVLDGDDVTLVTAGGTGSFGSNAIGQDKTIPIAGLTLSGEDAGNYFLTQPVATASITTRALLVAGVTAADKAYDGGTAVTVDFSNASLAGVVNGEDVTLVTSEGTGSFGSSAIGQDKTVTITGLTLSGENAGNYRLAPTTATASIITPSVTVSGVTASDKVYDGEITATVDFSGAALVGVLDGDEVMLVTTEGTGSFGSSAVGQDKTVSIHGLTLSGEDAGNYILTQPTATASITAQGLTVSGVTAADKVYDGETAALVDFIDASLVGVAIGADVTLVTIDGFGSFESNEVGQDKTVSITGLTLSGEDAGNYILTQPTATASITARALIVSGVTAADKVYDGETTATVDFSSAALVGVLDGDHVTLVTIEGAGSFENSAIGQDKIVSISGLTLSGEDAGNYILTQPTATASITSPLLAILLSNDAVVLTWEGDGFVLEATTSLTDPNWASVSYEAGSPNVAIETISENANFYRLRK